ncbi:MAG: D-alanyl-D-alanine carboxypeptidase [Chlamydiales bacterium]|nr:D-alanyl-D-alanine carboxypeptidase [Chlamydiales bacterium]
MLHYLCLFVLFSSSLCALNVQVSAPSALLINAKTSKVLYAKDSAKVLYPASITKVAFALYAIKHHTKLFDTVLTVSNNAVKSMTEAQKSKNNFSVFSSYILENDASHMGLKVGEQMRFYDLLVASMVVSADDASNVIAEAMGNGSIERCVLEVNRYITSLGCKNTHFMNPHGLHHPDHVTTADDLAIICQAAMQEPLFCNIAKMTRFERPKTNKQPATWLRSTNRLILPQTPFYYAPAVGIKTGYHRRAGYCLTAQAEKNGRALLSVVLQAKTNDERFVDSKKLFEKAFDEKLIQKHIVQAGPQTFSCSVLGGSSPLTTYTQKPAIVSYYPSEEPQIRCQLAWQQIPLPIAKDQPVGELLLLADDKVIQKHTLYAAAPVSMTWVYSLTHTFSFTTIIIIAAFVLLVTFVFFGMRSRR